MNYRREDVKALGETLGVKFLFMFFYPIRRVALWLWLEQAGWEV